MTRETGSGTVSECINFLGDNLSVALESIVLLQKQINALTDRVIELEKEKRK